MGKNAEYYKKKGRLAAVAWIRRRMEGTLLPSVEGFVMSLGGRSIACRATRAADMPIAKATSKTKGLFVGSWQAVAHAKGALSATKELLRGKTLDEVERNG